MHIVTAILPGSSDLIGIIKEQVFNIAKFDDSVEVINYYIDKIPKYNFSKQVEFEVIDLKRENKYSIFATDNLSEVVNYYIDKIEEISFNKSVNIDTTKPETKANYTIDKFVDTQETLNYYINEIDKFEFNRTVSFDSEKPNLTRDYFIKVNLKPDALINYYYLDKPKRDQATRLYTISLTPLAKKITEVFIESFPANQLVQHYNLQPIELNPNILSVLFQEPEVVSEPYFVIIDTPKAIPVYEYNISEFTYDFNEPYKVLLEPIISTDIINSYFLQPPLTEDVVRTYNLSLENPTQSAKYYLFVPDKTEFTNYYYLEQILDYNFTRTITFQDIDRNFLNPATATIDLENVQRMVNHYYLDPIKINEFSKEVILQSFDFNVIPKTLQMDISGIAAVRNRPFHQASAEAGQAYAEYLVEIRSGFGDGSLSQLVKIMENNLVLPDVESNYFDLANLVANFEFPPAFFVTIENYNRDTLRQYTRTVILSNTLTEEIQNFINNSATKQADSMDAFQRVMMSYLARSYIGFMNVREVNLPSYLEIQNSITPTGNSQATFIVDFESTTLSSDLSLVAKYFDKWRDKLTHDSAAASFYQDIHNNQLTSTDVSKLLELFISFKNDEVTITNASFLDDDNNLITSLGDFKSYIDNLRNNFESITVEVSNLSRHDLEDFTTNATFDVSLDMSQHDLSDSLGDMASFISHLRGSLVQDSVAVKFFVQTSGSNLEMYSTTESDFQNKLNDTYQYDRNSLIKEMVRVHKRNLENLTLDIMGIKDEMRWGIDHSFFDTTKLVQTMKDTIQQKEIYVYERDFFTYITDYTGKEYIPPEYNQREQQRSGHITQGPHQDAVTSLDILKGSFQKFYSEHKDAAYYQEFTAFLDAFQVEIFTRDTSGTPVTYKVLAKESRDMLKQNQLTPEKFKERLDSFKTEISTLDTNGDFVSAIVDSNKAREKIVELHGGTTLADQPTTTGIVKQAAIATSQFIEHTTKELANFRSAHGITIITPMSGIFKSAGFTNKWLDKHGKSGMGRDLKHVMLSAGYIKVFNQNYIENFMNEVIPFQFSAECQEMSWEANYSDIDFLQKNWKPSIFGGSNPNGISLETTYMALSPGVGIDRDAVAQASTLDVGLPMNPGDAWSQFWYLNYVKGIELMLKSLVQPDYGIDREHYNPPPLIEVHFGSVFRYNTVENPTRMVHAEYPPRADQWKLYQVRRVTIAKPHEDFMFYIRDGIIQDQLGFKVTLELQEVQKNMKWNTADFSENWWAANVFHSSMYKDAIGYRGRDKDEGVPWDKVLAGQQGVQGNQTYWQLYGATTDEQSRYSRETGHYQTGANMTSSQYVAQTRPDIFGRTGNTGA